jgi:protein tyrosine phosphatase (PTP) superfamily phosphohydrolase (DUF442 family)
MNASRPRCRLAAAALLLGAALAHAQAHAQPAAGGLAAPNVVEISPQLVTSGQPSAAALGQLKALGFDAVIYLAPPTVGDAVRDEPLIVARQGLAFVNIPIRFDKPTEADFEAFAGVLGALRGRKVLVHCQINMRASAMVFLYRSVVLKEPPQPAQEAMNRVWSPDGPWRELLQAQLRKHGIAHELL